jgi:putative ABC transport system ATP-binding protein
VKAVPGNHWTLVLKRARSDRLVLVTAFLVVLLSTALVSAIPLYATAVAQSGLSARLERAPATEANVQVTVDVFDGGTGRQVDRRVSRNTRDVFETTGASIFRSGESEPFRAAGRIVVFGFQAFGLIPILTAAENVEVPLRLRRVEPADRAARVQDLLQLVDLSNRAKHRPQELSGGEQQRVAIARALANEPRLLLADEPTGQVDSQRARTIMGLLRRLTDERGVTVIVATHDPLLIAMAGHAVELRDGAIVGQDGSPRRLPPDA